MADEERLTLFALVSMGVGSALGGDFYGYQLVLGGGFGLGLITVLFMAVFFWFYAAVITELTFRYRSSGGSFEFVRCALGEQSSKLMAVLSLSKILLNNCVLAITISTYLVTITSFPGTLQFIVWGCLYSLSAILDIAGLHQSASIQMCVIALCVAVLIIYGISTLTKFREENITSGGLIHGGPDQFFKSLPFALQYFDGFEDLPLLSSYAHHPTRDIPRAILISYMIIFVQGLVVMIGGSGCAPTGTSSYFCGH